MIAQQITQLLEQHPTGTFAITAKPAQGSLPARLAISFQVGDVLWHEAVLAANSPDEAVAEAFLGLRESIERGVQLPGVQEKLDAHLASGG